MSLAVEHAGQSTLLYIAGGAGAADGYSRAAITGSDEAAPTAVTDGVAIVGTSTASKRTRGVRTHIIMYATGASSSCIATVFGYDPALATALGATKGWAKLEPLNASAAITLSTGGLPNFASNTTQVAFVLSAASTYTRLDVRLTSITGTWSIFAKQEHL